VKRLSAVLIFLAVLLIAGCGNSVNSFEGQIEKIEDNGFLIGCSDAANKGKKGGINDIGYTCNVQYNEETIFRDVDGNLLNADDILTSSIVNVILKKPADIRKKFEKKTSLELTAKEIVLLEK